MVTDVSAFIFEKIKGIPQAVKYAILSALIIGFVTHIVFYTSNIVNHDSVANIADTCGWLLSQGKWFAEATSSGIRGIYPANGITTPLAIIYLALASGFTVSALSIKKPIYAILISGFLVTFPSVASSLLYHGGDYFCVTLLLAAMAAYFTIKFKWGFLIGIVTLTLSLGSYMAYIGYSAALMLSVCLIDSISNKKSAKDILLQALKYIAVLVVACLFYYGILQLRLQQLNVGLSDYRGIDQMGQFSLSTLPGIICQSVLKVINFFKSDLFGTGASIFVWMYRLMALLGVILASVSVWKSRAYRKITKVLLTVLFVLLFPIAIHLIAILGMNTETSWIMIFPFVAAFILVIKLMENFQVLCEEQKESKHYKKVVSFARLISWTGVVLSAALIFNWAIVSNQIYYCMQYTYETSYATALKIADDITEVEGYTKDTPVLIGMDEGMTITPPNAEALAPLTKYTGVLVGHIYHRDMILLYFIYNNIGLYMPVATEGQAMEIKNSQEYKEMPLYPDEKSAQMIDGVAVVKIS